MSQHKLDLNDPAVSMLVKARVRLLLEKGVNAFFGNMAYRMNIVEVDWCPTAATDGRDFYFNREFILGLSPDEIVFLFGHEVLHGVFDHIGRRGSRDPKIWNMATDYIVNYTLVSEGIGKMIEGGLYDKAYTDDLAAEELYDLLIKNSATIKLPLDTHLELRQPGDGDDDGEGEGGSVEVRVMGKNGPPTLTPEDVEEIREKIKHALIQTATSIGADNVPKGVRRLIGNLIEPKMDWRALLDCHIRSAEKDDFTFNRLSRRTVRGGYIFPGQDFANTIDIVISIDASGSLTDAQLRDIMSECKGIMESFADFKVRLFSFDTSVHNYLEITPANVGDFDTWSPGGGGGTSFECVFTYLKDNEIEPNRLVMFTDGYPNHTWGDQFYCDTLFVIVPANKSITAPYGITCHYDEKPPK